MTEPTFYDVFRWSHKNHFKGSFKFYIQLVIGLFQSILLLLVSLLHRKKKHLKKHPYLFIYPSKKSFQLNKQKSLLELFSKDELNIATHAKKLSDVIDMGYSPCLDPSAFLFPKMAWRAKYILKEHALTKVIIVERYDAVFNFFLKKYKQKHQRIVFLAHSIITNDSPKFNLAICDDYILFGKSSTLAIKNNQQLLGSPNLIETGPYFLNQVKSWEPSSTASSLLLVACGSGFEKNQHIKDAYQEIDNWCEANHIKLDVKPHPLGLNYSDWSSNTTILAAHCKLSDIIPHYIGALCIYSNAIVDITATGIPSGIYTSSLVEDPWDAKKHLTNIASSKDMKSFVIQCTQQTNKLSLQSKKFSSFHWHDANRPAAYTAEKIRELAR